MGGPARSPPGQPQESVCRGRGAEGPRVPMAALTGAEAGVPLDRTRVFRPLLLLRVLFFAPPGSSNLLGV